VTPSTSTITTTIIASALEVLPQTVFSIPNPLMAMEIADAAPTTAVNPAPTAALSLFGKPVVVTTSTMASTTAAAVKQETKTNTSTAEKKNPATPSLFGKPVVVSG